MSISVFYYPFYKRIEVTRGEIFDQFSYYKAIGWRLNKKALKEALEQKGATSIDNRYNFGIIVGGLRLPYIPGSGHKTEMLILTNSCKHSFCDDIPFQGLVSRI